MKKALTAILSALLICSALALSSCSSGTQPANTSSQAPASSATEAPTQNPDNVRDENLTYADYTEYKLETDVPVKNIILMIGDGMGLNAIKCAEIQKGGKFATAAMPYTAKVTTDSLSGTTDSAAAATALACGVKTYNKYIGMDKDGKAVESITEVAKSYGMKTGFAVTEHVAHATPAGFTAHVENRDSFMQILGQQLKADIDVMLGGGQQFYRKGVKKLIGEHDYTYVSTPSELDALKPGKKVLGMFKYENILAGYKPSLETETKKALELLENDNGFFLMVEGSDIDTRESLLDMDATLKEMKVFDHAIDTVLDYASKNPGTLVIVTADHETGGIKIPENATAMDLTNDLFTSGGEHTSTNVGIFAAGAQADKLFSSDLIDNTDVAKMMKRVLKESHQNTANSAA